MKDNTTSFNLSNEIRLQQASSQGPTPETISMHELVDVLDELLCDLHRVTEYQYLPDMIVH